MSKSLRLFLFLLFFFAFLISAPIVVLYTAGYRVDLTHGRIVHTAVLNISSNPRNASVRLDDETVAQERTPAVMDTILPGEHTIILEKQNYLPWETTLSFESREARVLGPIVLFLDEQPTLQQSLQATLTSVHAESNRFVYATQESSWVEVWIVDATTSHTRLLMRLPYTATSTYAFSWSANAEYLALIETHGSRQDISVTRVRDGMAVDLPKETQNVEASWWDLEVASRLYVRTGTQITQIAMERLDTVRFPYAAWLVTTREENIVTLSESGKRSVVSFQEGETASILTYLPLGTYHFVEAPGNLIALEDTRHHRLVLLDPENREQPILLNEEATLWRWHPSENILLYSSGYDLKRYIRSAHETQTITRLSTPIDALDWYPEGNCVLYRSGGELVALNLDDVTILSQTVLTTNLPGTFWLNPNGTSLSSLIQTQTGWEWWTRALQN
ncbi:PEGA domain-containing protein [Candidatus Uhrbacteria bacterium]|nr:PEGA domain-containing protein [Candidatus Uhrbacteria bacterium]